MAASAPTSPVTTCDSSSDYGRRTRSARPPGQGFALDQLAGCRHAGDAVEYLGHVEYDDTVWSCVRARRLLLIESPGTKASKNVEMPAGGGVTFTCNGSAFPQMPTLCASQTLYGTINDQGVPVDLKAAGQKPAA